MSLRKTIVNPSIFREYIGSKLYPRNFDDFPDICQPQIGEFHFIIAFAAEVYNESKSGKGRVGTGNFYRNWFLPPINGEMIQRLKNKYKNMKVIISIGGRGPEYPFNPDKQDTWPDSARDSLIDIIKVQLGDHLIDGIDINYNVISSDADVFVDCIGRLIRGLKKDLPSIKVVSIAPSASVRPYYTRLYAANEKDIDWVNYQFYTQKISSAEGFEDLYRQLTEEDYPNRKLLAGFSTDPDDAGHLRRQDFLDACKDLIAKKELPGIFIWNANDSASNEYPFQTEEYAQDLFPKN